MVFHRRVSHRQFQQPAPRRRSAGISRTHFLNYAGKLCRWSGVPPHPAIAAPLFGMGRCRFQELRQFHHRFSRRSFNSQRGVGKDAFVFVQTPPSRIAPDCAACSSNAIGQAFRHRRLSASAGRAVHGPPVMRVTLWPCALPFQSIGAARAKSGGLVISPPSARIPGTATRADMARAQCHVFDQQVFDRLSHSPATPAQRRLRAYSGNVARSISSAEPQTFSRTPAAWRPEFDDPRYYRHSFKVFTSSQPISALSGGVLPLKHAGTHARREQVIGDFWPARLGWACRSGSWRARGQTVPRGGGGYHCRRIMIKPDNHASRAPPWPVAWSSLPASWPRRRRRR